MSNKILHIVVFMLLFLGNLFVPSHAITEAETPTINDNFQEIMDAEIHQDKIDRIRQERNGIIVSREPQILMSVPVEVESAIDRAADKYSVPKDILFSEAMQESKFDYTQTGSCGDIGLFQILPSTAYEINKHIGISNFRASMLYGPTLNAEFAAWYLSYLHSLTNNWVMTITAYNEGFGGMSKFVRSHGNADSLYYESVSEKHKDLYGSLLNY